MHHLVLPPLVRRWDAFVLKHSEEFHASCLQTSSNPHYGSALPAFTALSSNPSLSVVPPRSFSLALLSRINDIGTLVIADPVDLTSANRRPPIHGLPDWSRAGFEEGARALPTDADIGKTIGPQAFLDAGLTPDDGQDDTAAFQEVLDTMGELGSPAKDGHLLIISSMKCLGAVTRYALHRSL